jgi:DNA-binding NarL/FixJ family response regulator
VARRWGELGLHYRAAYAALRAAEEGLRLRRRGAAKASVQSAWHMAGDIGAVHLVREAERVARAARLPLPDVETPAPAPLGISPRELEVLRLLADGLTDREVGARLFISHRTVERHVSNLLGKLGVSRRAELVAVAHRNDLV